ncbi:hypothetical protein MNBD_GAMMA08-2904 [hydrothermal vent metagenome]|uniref:4Fe4S-binding SPASM domain-containing protein n=1 Tax=hydrothermal vent metagenome TaxID=652676 RepID=A0A3B0XFW4_9ZZZZ
MKSRKPCYWPWHTIVIAWDGKVSPCCRHGDFELGNAIQNDTHSIWAGAAYLNLRTPFTGKTYGEEMNLHCRECMGISIEEPTNAGLKVSMNNSNI